MRVLVMTTVYPNVQQPTLGVFVRERARRMAEHCDVVIVAPVPWFPFNRFIRGARQAAIPRRERQGRLEVHHPRFLCVPRYAKWLDGVLYAVSLAPFMLRLRRRFAFDVIDAHFAYPDGFAAVLLGRLFRRPVMITLRGSIVRLATYRSHRPLLRLALRKAARVLAVSESLKRVAIGLGIAPCKVRVIPNGVDSTCFAPRDRAQARRALDLPDDRTIVLSVGGLNEGKGHHLLLHVLPQLLERRADLLLVIVGGERPGDSIRSRLEAAIESTGLGNRVLLAGPRPHEEIALWMAAADLFCLATRSEGWANVLLEAMACGLPVVTTRVGGNPEIVAREELGTLVPAGDEQALREAILQALERAWDRDVMVAHARRYSWDSTVRDVVGELRALIGRPTAEHAEALVSDGPAGGRP